MHTHIDRVFTTVSRNLGLQDFSKYVDNWIEWAYEAEKYIGSMDTFVQKESTYTSSGAKASGTITFSAVPTSGDYIELNGVRLYFKDLSTSIGNVNSPNELYIKPTLSATLAANSPQHGLIQSLRGYRNVTLNNFRIVESAIFNYPEALNKADYSVDTTTLTITAKDIGEKGNDYTLASDNANAVVSGLTLTGGKGIYKNQQIRLPDNMVKLLGVRVGADDSTYEHEEFRRTSAVHRSRVGKNANDSQQRAQRYYVDGNRLNITHDDLDEITIVYLAYPTDMRGWPMIKDGHETAVAQYIMWQHKLIKYYNGELPQYITKDLEKRWYFLCGKVRGDDGMPTSEELKQIGNMWNTLIPLKNNHGLINF
mgnify:CR=1 FL=1